MNKIYFNLDSTLGFKNFEILSFDKTKNSPSAPVLRGKGSMFSAENFTFNDRIGVKMHIKRDLKDTSGLTEIQRVYAIYAMFRTKGMVFVNSSEIFNKVFPGMELLKVERLKIQIQETLSRTATNELSEEYLETVADTIIKYRLVDNYNDFKNDFFPGNTGSTNIRYPNESTYNKLVDKYKNVKLESPLSVDLPFLVMLEKFSIKNIVATSDGFIVNFTFCIVEDLFNERIQTVYKEVSQEFLPFYQSISTKQNSYLSSANSNDFIMEIRGIENNRLKTSDFSAKDKFKPNIQTEIVEQKLGFKNEDITEFEIISHNNISHVPIQGRSKTLKQYMGVGETNFSIKMFFKNDESSGDSSRFLSKLRTIQYLTELEQRQLRITGKFGYLNALDFHGLEISDIHYSNDTETDGIMVTMIFKASGYRYDQSNVNAKGEAVDEFPLQRTKNFSADDSIYSSGFYNFFNKIKEYPAKEIEEIIIDVDGTTEFNLLSMCDSYYSVPVVYKFFGEYLKGTSEQLGNFQSGSAVTSVDKKYYDDPRNDYTTDKHRVMSMELHGLRTLLGYYSIFNFNGVALKLFETSFSDNEANSPSYAHTDYIDRIKKQLKDSYGEVLVQMVHSMFPTISYEEQDYFLIETLKVAYLDFLVNSVDITINILLSERYKGKTLLDYFNENLDSIFHNKIDQSNLMEIMLKASIKKFQERLEEEVLIAKITEVFKVQMVEQKKYIDPKGLQQPEKIYKKINQSIGKIKDAFESGIVNIDKLKYKLLTIKDARYVSFLNKINQSKTPQYSKITRYNDSLDIIGIGMLGIFSINFGVSSSAFGSIVDTVGRKIVDRGIVANSLFNSAPNDINYNLGIIGTDSLGKTIENNIIGKANVKEKVQKPILESLFGGDFVEKADLNYRPLTSNVALTDLGSFLNVSSGHLHSKNKIVYKACLDALDFNDTAEDIEKGTVRKSKIFNEVYTLLEKKINNFKDTVQDIDGVSKNLELGLRQEPLVTNDTDNVKDKRDENITKISATVKNFQDTHTRMFDNFYNNDGNIISNNINSVALKKARYDSMIKYGDVLKGFSDLYSSNIFNTVPTYDIYVIRDSVGINVNSSAETLKLEDHFALDKLLDLKIQYTEDIRGKTATFSFIDNTEDIKDYYIKPISFQNEDGDIGSQEANGSITPGQHYDTKTKRILKPGDGISIRMGYNNQNKCVFNGVVQSITGGKVKNIICISHSAELNYKKFDIKIKDGASNVLGSISQVFKTNFNDAYETLKETKRTSPHINKHIILDDITTPNVKGEIYDGGGVDFNNVGLYEEKSSNYNIVFVALTKAMGSLKHFSSRKSLYSQNLATNQKRSEDYIDSTGTFFKNLFTDNPNKGLYDDNLVVNINNVDRDSSLYGIELSTTLSAKHDYFHVGSNLYKLRGSSYVDSKFRRIAATHAVYAEEDTSLFDTLVNTEKRSPGTYFDILESGFNSTIFYGRSNYKIKRKDYTEEKQYQVYESQNFLKNLNSYNIQNSKRALDSFKILANSVSQVEPKLGLITNEGYKENDIEFDKTTLENAQNKIYLVTGKNLISNKLTVNNNIKNSVSVNYSGNLADHAVNLVKRGRTSSKVTIYSIPPLEDNENRVRELIISDDNIKNIDQALERAQSELQMQLESYYDGKIIMLFNPDIRYRTEIVIHDTVNEMYGSFLVRDFEHMFTSQGSYTIIRPMMKVSPNNVLDNLTRKCFIHHLFHDTDDNEIASEFSKSLTSANFYSTQDVSKPSVEYSMFNDIIEREVSNKPIICGGLALEYKDTGKQESKKIVKDLSDINALPLKMEALVFKADYLIPDLDLYGYQEESLWRSISNFFSNISKGFSALFLNEKKNANVFEKNIITRIGESIVDRFGRLTYPSTYVLERLNKDSVIGITTDTNKYSYDLTKEILLRGGYTPNPANGVNTHTYSDKNTIGFFNAKAISVNEPQRIKEIAKVISNFKVCGVVEICSVSNLITNGNYLDSNGESVHGQQPFHSGESYSKQVVDKILEHLKSLDKENKNSDSHKYNWKVTSFELVRKSASAFSVDNVPGFYDEYGCVFYRDPVLKQNDSVVKNELFISSNASKTIRFNTSKIVKGVLMDTPEEVIITLPSVKIKYVKDGIDQEISCYFVHNVYSSFTNSKDFYSPASRAEGVKAIFTAFKSQTAPNEFIMGDFNISMVNNSYTSSDYNPIPIKGEVIELTDYDYEGLQVDSRGFESLFTVASTTINSHGWGNKFDHILFRENTLLNGLKIKSSGPYRNIIIKDFVTTRDLVSDHCPVYVEIE